MHGRPWVAPAMHMIMGIDSTKFTREAMPAVLRALAFSASVAATIPRIFFWFGQIRTQTLNSMMVPSQAPVPMTARYEGGEAPATAPKVKAPRKLPDLPRSHAPPTQVATAPQRNQKSARGATYLVMPAPPGPPLSAAASASAGVCATLK